jgi:predicted nucleotidyltransferase
MKKENAVAVLFFNEPAKHWRFEDIVKTAKISRTQANFWLKKFCQEGLVKRVKPRGKMPYYCGNYAHANYQIKKRLFALVEMHAAGFLQHLVSLSGAKTVVIFGSMSRWDWYGDSDIDVFIFGDAGGLEQGRYELKLHRNIQVFAAKTAHDVQRFSFGLLQSIVAGYLVKGTFDFVEVAARA